MSTGHTIICVQAVGINGDLKGGAHTSLGCRAQSQFLRANL